MPPPNRRRVQEIYFEALEYGPDRRRQFVARACRGDRALEGEVRAMLDSYERMDSFLTRPLLDEFAGALAPTPLPPRLGRYRIGRLLGTGGMGRVYHARDETLERDVAIKVIQLAPGRDASAFARVEREARLLASLNHPAIATVHSLEEEEGFRFFSMEFLEGPTLDEAIGKDALAREDAVEICRGIAAALEAAHASGVLHCDLKPGNVQATAHGAWKVLDFGIGRLRREERSGNEGRAAPRFCTPGYASPEQVRGEALDERSDLFSLGCVMFECFTGSPAFPAGPDAVEATLHGSPDWDALAGRCGPAVERVVRALLEKRPGRRPREAAEVRRVLDAERLRREMAGVRRAPPEHQPTHHNLPEPQGRFVGREELLSRVRASLADGGLVTLTGPPGCGKSRIALEFARGAVPRYPDGVWLVDLTSVRDRDGVLGAVANAFGFRERGDLALAEQLGRRLEGRRMLLVLDNCEHVVDACAGLLVVLLAANSASRVIATSREALELAGETRIPVAPLDGNGAEAGELFAARLAEAREGAGPAEEERAAIARICQRLDGIPLAIELAAARGRTLPVDEIENRLAHQLRFLRSPRRDGGHHSALESAIRWSYDLLDDAEQTLFRRLALFRGFTLDAAEAAAAGDALPAWDVLDALERLVAKSLVTVETRVEASGLRFRYRLLECLRQFAESQLDRPERRHLQERIGDFFERWCEEASRNMHGDAQVEWLERAADEEANLLAAILELSNRKPARAMVAFCRMLTFWETRGTVSAAATAIETLLGRLNPEHEGPELAWGWIVQGALDAVRGRNAAARETWMKALRTAENRNDRPRFSVALTRLANLDRITGDYERARARYRQVLDLYRELGDARNVAGTLGNLGVVEEELGNLVAARRLGEESLELLRALADWRGVAVQLNNLGVLYRDDGDRTEARRSFEECLDLRMKLGDRRGAALAHNNLGSLDQLEGSLENAQRHFRAALDLSEELGDEMGSAGARCNLGMVALERGDLQTARTMLTAGLRQLAAQDARPWVVQVLEAAARLEFACDAAGRAAQLAGGADALRRALALRRADEDARTFDELCERLRETLGETECDAEFARGADMSLESLVALADPS